MGGVSGDGSGVVVVLICGGCVCSVYRGRGHVVSWARAAADEGNNN